MTHHQAGLGPRIGQGEALDADLKIKIPAFLLVGECELIAIGSNIQAGRGDVVAVRHGSDRARTRRVADVQWNIASRGGEADLAVRGNLVSSGGGVPHVVYREDISRAGSMDTACNNEIGLVGL